MSTAASRLSVHIMLALLLLAIATFTLMVTELANTPFIEWWSGFPPPARDMSFLTALFCSCGLVSWMYATVHVERA